jgi:hypothetical protein
MRAASRRAPRGRVTPRTTASHAVCARPGALRIPRWTHFVVVAIEPVLDHSHTLPCMSCRPHAFAFFRPTGCVVLDQRRRRVGRGGKLTCRRGPCPAWPLFAEPRWVGPDSRHISGQSLGMCHCSGSRRWRTNSMRFSISDRSRRSSWPGRGRGAAPSLPSAARLRTSCDPTQLPALPDRMHDGHQLLSEPPPHPMERQDRELFILVAERRTPRRLRPGEPALPGAEHEEKR